MSLKNSTGEYYTIDGFISNFKVGDKIRAVGWINPVIITAIGETRFLHKVDGRKDSESVATIRNVKWVKES